MKHSLIVFVQAVVVFVTGVIGMDRTERAIFGGGCFWCVEAPYGKLAGVKSVMPGYTGGKTKNPTYEQVCTGTTGHAEAVEVIFDPSIVSYTHLLEVYLMNIDPTDQGGQFYDRGSQYRPEIFYTSDEQKILATKSLKKLGDLKIFDKPISVKVSSAQEFYTAEKYHQGYYCKFPDKYERYKKGSGRSDFIHRHWDKKQLDLGTL